MKHRTCNAIGCRAAILDTEVFCYRHLVMVESDVKRVLGRTFRPGMKHQSAVFSDTLERARREILYFVTNGHAVPRDRPFMWDEDEGGEQC